MMANRRQFIQSSLLMSALTVTEVVALPTGSDTEKNSSSELKLFVFDQRFKEAVKIAQLAEVEGIPQYATSGDLTDLWYQQLNTQWKQAPMTLAGVTAIDGLFVLETLAADYGMRVLRREELGTFAAKGSTQKEVLLSWIIAPRNSQI